MAALRLLYAHPFHAERFIAEPQIKVSSKSLETMYRDKANIGSVPSFDKACTRYHGMVSVVLYVALSKRSLHTITCFK